MRASNILNRGRAVAVLCVMAAVACAPRAEPASGTGPTTRAAQAPKTLTIGILSEPSIGGGGGGPGGASAPRYIAHDRLVVQTNTQEFVPELAVEQISADKSTWVINADGSMDTTWRIHRNVKWQDGAPFTTADLLFSVLVNTDKEVPTRQDLGAELMQSWDAPDPYTLRIHWSEPFAFANRAPALNPLPRHLLEEDYKADKQNLPNHPYFTTQFVGLGPYRLVHWEPGSHMEFTRFDDYHRGRPPLDKVVIRILGDSNTAVATALAGQVDALVGSGVDLDAALEVKRRWEGTGNQVSLAPTGGLQHLVFQMRPEYAKPSALLNRSVRQALLYATDRQELANAMTSGLPPVADSWIQPDDALRPQVESAIPQYPHDPARAQRLLTEAGWIRGSDGVLVHQPDGEGFEQSLLAFPGQSGSDKLIAVIADYWKAVGVAPVPGALSRAQYGDDEYVAKLSAPKISGSFAENSYLGNLNTDTLAGPANGWRGKNQMGYSNPRFDAITSQIIRTIEPSQWVQLQREALQEALTDVALFPLFWPQLATFLSKGVKAHPVVYQRELWDFFYWDKE